VHCLPLLSVNLGKPKMKTHTFNCEKCGNITKILVDGYPFGDRLRSRSKPINSYANFRPTIIRNS